MDWWPWGEPAFAEARRRDVPVFLSVGYATCHWCHVMERESFEDPDVAALLNEAFVCVKVDREERPDVDQFYMGVTQALTGSGGWPMTVALTPEREPFFAGTYFPKAGRMGRPGMLEIVPALQRAWGEDRLAVVASAARIRDALARHARQQPGAMPGVEILDAGHAQLAERFDPRHGGFGHAPKFPTPHDLSFLLRYHARTGEIPALTMVTRTLDGMRRGGLFDHVGFGFHRYSTDERWLLPHFEKMLYDQALLAIAYLDAWQATGEAAHARVAREIATYVLRDMTSPQGGFFSAEDADSEGVEGKFYLWTPEELREVLGEADAELVADVFGVEQGGNFRDQATGERTGESILHLPRPLADAAARRGMDETDLLAAWDAARGKLFAHRQRRVRPLLDDKVLTDWNGLMIASLARAGAALDEPAWIEAARRAAGFVLDTLRTPEGRLLKRWRDGHAALPGVLDDHAFLAWGLLELWQATFEPRWLEASLATVETLLAHFHDAEGGGFFTTADDGEPLPVRMKEVHDGALPSGNSVAADVLLRLGRLTGRADFEEAAEGVFRAFSDSVQRIPSAHAHLLMALDFAIGPSAEIVIAGEPRAPDTKAMLAALRRGFRPNALVILRPPEGPAALDVIRLLPWTGDHAPRDGRATAYVCRGRACSLPTTDPDEMLRQAAP